MDGKIKLVFVSTNQGKLREVNRYLPNWITLVGLDQLGEEPDIVEDATTFEGNAQIKSTYFSEENVFYLGDDSGLMVDALNGEPGVYSARYAGEPKDDAKNRLKVLEQLKSQSLRKASFITVLALTRNGKTHFFEGRVQGEIVDSEKGSNGFGYDCIFRPDGDERTFGEMTIDEKAVYSHRTKALQCMIEWLAEKKDELIF